MPFFNKKRKLSISGRRISRYLLYAIGEILLVVIGILIAISINDWRERIKERELLSTYLKDYRNDLLTDSIMVIKNLELLNKKKTYFDMVLSDSLSEDKLLKNPMVFNLITTFNPIQLQSKGYNEISNYANKTEMEKDTLIQNIISNHNYFKKLIDVTMNNIANDISDNMQFYKTNKPWIGDLMTQKLTSEIKSYFVSKDYYNRVAVHEILVYSNLYNFLENYQVYIRETIPQIEKRLDEISKN